MDPIANMLTSIRNALAVQHETVTVPFSNLKYQVALILEKNNFLKKVEKKGRKTKTIEITLKYLPVKDSAEKNIQPAISGIRKISKPGQRIYLNSIQMKKVKGGYGMAIISTSKGIITDQQARKQKIGGEVICEVW